MEERINIGYRITDSIHIGETEFVIGEKPSKPPMFVTWACKNGNDYCWGHYLGSRADSERDLVKRAAERLRFLESIRGRKGREFER